MRSKTHEPVLFERSVERAHEKFQRPQLLERSEFTGECAELLTESR